MSPTTLNSILKRGREAALLAAVLLSGGSGQLLAGETSLPQVTVRSNAATAANEAWRMQYHNNQWWYWHPSNRWSVYQNNRWTPYDSQANVQNRRSSPTAGEGAVRYESGYRGVPTNPAPQVTSPVYAPAARGAGSEPSGGMNGQPNDPFIRGN